MMNKKKKNVINVLPLVYTLTGCDGTSKIGSKNTASKVVESGFWLKIFYKSVNNPYQKLWY